MEHAYAELGLAPGASAAEVKAAWRRLVAQWHPDRNPTPGAHSRMQRINAAYESIRLTDSGPATADAPAPAGRVVRRRVRLELEEAAAGCQRTLRGRQSIECEPCDGRGYRTLASACPACGGAGTVRKPSWYGWMASTATCSDCAGAGTARHACSACTGRGRHSRGYRHEVRIPPGARDGDLLQARTAAGALELRIELAPHPFFVLDEDGTLRCEMPVDGFAWMAERWVEVPTLAGLQQMRLRREHQQYRLRGQGYPGRGAGARGDLVVSVRPRFPDTLSAEQEALLDRLAAAAPGAVQDWQRRLQAWARRSSR